MLDNLDGGDEGRIRVPSARPRPPLCYLDAMGKPA